MDLPLTRISVMVTLVPRLPVRTLPWHDIVRHILALSLAVMAVTTSYRHTAVSMVARHHSV